jgi:hypothetical protein
VSSSIETLAEIDRVVGQWCLNQVPVQIKHEVDYDYELDGRLPPQKPYTDYWTNQCRQIVESTQYLCKTNIQAST